MKILVNKQEFLADTLTELKQCLSLAATQQQLELWIETSDGPTMCMLRSRANAWLMYLRFPGDSGFSSRGNASQTASASYILTNGQVDEYPLQWCVGVPTCLEAIEEFWINGGGMPSKVAWNAD